MARSTLANHVIAVNNGNSTAILFFDETTGGDLAWAFGADDRGSTGQAGKNAMTLRLGSTTGLGANVSYQNTFATADTWNSIGVEVCCWDQLGRWGLGSATPSYNVHVVGTTRGSGSSIEYKEQISKIDDAKELLDKVLQLRPVKYSYKEEHKHLGKNLKTDYQIGLIAEEVAEVFPELAILLKENGKEVVRNVDYEKLSVILFKVLQYLEEEIGRLEDLQN